MRVKILFFVAAMLLAAQALASPWGALMRDAMSAQRKGKSAQAEGLLMKALLEAEQFNSPDPRLGYTLDYLGSVIESQGRHDEAAPFFERAFEVFMQARGEGSDEAGQCAFRAAESWLGGQRWAKAERWYREADRMGSLASDPLAQSTLWLGLGLSCDAQERLDEALSYYEKALNARRQRLGSEAPEVAEILTNQARVLYLKGDAAGAERLFRQALAIDEKALGPKSLVVADDLDRLAPLLLKLGQKDEAEAMAKRAAGLRKPKSKGKKS